MMNYTRESLELVEKEDGFPGLREIGKLFDVKSTGSDAMIVKILEAQNDVPVPGSSKEELVLTGLDDLLVRKRDMEVHIENPNAYFPPLVPEDRLKDIKSALESFAHQWAFDKIEFFFKFQAFRLYKGEAHVDWIGLNELFRRYDLKLPLAAKTAARRLYTAPAIRAYR